MPSMPGGSRDGRGRTVKNDSSAEKALVCLVAAYREHALHGPQLHAPCSVWPTDIHPLGLREPRVRFDAADARHPLVRSTDGFARSMLHALPTRTAVSDGTG